MTKDDVITLITAKTLAAVRHALSPLRVCQADDCSRLFFKTTRKAFCSERCRSRTYMRRYRAKKRHAKGDSHDRRPV